MLLKQLVKNTYIHLLLPPINDFPALQRSLPCEDTETKENETIIHNISNIFYSALNSEKNYNIQHQYTGILYLNNKTAITTKSTCIHDTDVQLGDKLKLVLKQ